MRPRWTLDAADRERLLECFPPAYDQVDADHVTAGGANASQPATGRVIGVADDGRGVQALVVEIGGTAERPDGSVFHITWSLDSGAGREASESNDVIAEHGWTPAAPETLRLHPAPGP